MSEFCSLGAEDTEAGSGIKWGGWWKECWGKVGTGRRQWDSPTSRLSGPSVGWFGAAEEMPILEFSI